MGDVHTYVINIEPKDFSKTSRNAIEDNINALYANKVIHKVGLAICFFDLLSASDGLIGAERSDVVHVKVHTEFFSNIFVPAPHNLFPGSEYVEESGEEPVWVWKHESNPFYFDKNEEVRFRVEEEMWTDLSPRDEEEIEACRQHVPALQHRIQQLQIALSKFRHSGSAAGGGSSKQSQHGKDEQQIMELLNDVKAELKETELKAQQRPWRIVGSMAMGGLGLFKWWSAGEDEEMVS